MESVVVPPDLLEWEAPEFEEFGCGPEVTMYVDRWEE
ncbi:pyrroloquinoline quinone precursor peptide PqqA [Micromonospora deserti]|uniref:Coenzyme PQQ synthesis protein A n=1 Tax=Micromonospora deserti TaxID=2070366 RepID=A0A2W2DGB6_9ACTN|nr:pyrroloquinoline quinone precursor peptide PqqA [Micromonospora deserti]PZG02979.1 pyrroloquinoline quinone precursor peptide PqqA [Micromonospora deserti]